MAVPLIAAGAKVAGKAVAKKVLAKKAATLAAKQAGKQAAKKGIQKISTKAVKGKVGNLRKTSKEVNKAINLKDQVSDEGEKVKRKRDLLDRFLKKEKNVSAPEGEKTSKLVFNSALFCAIIKDVIEIYLTIYVSS
jgi:translation initiation factor 2 beta subunit (eIF-2beta)/eIF-5